MGKRCFPVDNSTKIDVSHNEDGNVMNTLEYLLVSKSSLVQDENAMSYGHSRLKINTIQNHDDKEMNFPCYLLVPSTN